ncbi:hypothetical protein N7468_006126 [Penicillium chermesinum]|uniref:Zn(2)-C6 fungal-type domain-containing protein n=1 Tax=Penicillium chermesinum TaxID=63820 RepID=A0A9W9TNM1_9EURO|nr:uncharacterized protein N7468_006126 [Penicillium chermesinum]KAJ5233170.1 hypothetical protein N7468_006126 [Penicillium chermesinum]
MEVTPITQTHRATRASLACLPCRSRHVKCDGKRPCGRCSEVGNQCSYARSRRGGLDRAAVAERRKRLASAVYPEPVDLLNLQQAAIVRPEECLKQLVPADVHTESDLLDIDRGNSSRGSIPQSEDTVPSRKIESDILIESYYKNFHICHPFVLPRNHLTKLYQDPSRQRRLAPLVAALRFMGNIYKARKWSIPLKDDVETSLSPLSPSDPIQVQCRILYSVALFWYDYKDDAKWQMDRAAQLAIDMQMFRAGFAASGTDDQVQRESWRRTWWTLYILDVYYAGTLGTMNFRVVDIDVTAELPCDESDYESGVSIKPCLAIDLRRDSLCMGVQNIPAPRTLREFNHREFIPNSGPFSSFAYQISAIQCAATAISQTPKIATAEDSTHLIQAVDCSLDAWQLLLPPEHKDVMDRNGEIDELMFQAHMLIHVSTIGLHRPLSALKFNAIEHVSSCAREPPLDTPTPDLINVHTARVLRAVEAQIRLLALPVRRFHHTPFTTCMVSEGILALLSACSTLLEGKDLAIARDQIRMTLGCLKVLGEVWPRTARNVREIQTIAQCVLGLGPVVSNHNNSATIDLLAFGADEISPDSTASGLSADSNDLSASVGDTEYLHGWYNPGDLDDLSWRGTDYNLGHG